MNKNRLISIIAVIVIAIGGYFLFVQNQPEVAAPVTSQPDMMEEESMAELNGQSVEYMPGVTGYLALPDGGGQHPALILIHEWWGLNSDIKLLADRYAQEGYTALAVDMYEGQSTTDPNQARELATAVRNDIDGAFANLTAATNYLKGRPEVDSDKLASVGWCFGGGWAYQMAVNDLGVDASVMYYGQFNPEDDFAMMKADILGHFGEEDTGIAVDDVREFQAALATANGRHEVYIYPNVGHGFANIRDGDNLAYSEEASELAWQRTSEFLNGVFAGESLTEGSAGEEDSMEDDAAMEEPEEVTISLTGKNFEFSQDEIRVKQGTRVTINFSSESGFHDWVVDEFNAATDQVDTGGSASVTFVADKAGIFEYYCSVGRHREMGMFGRLIVE